MGVLARRRRAARPPRARATASPVARRGASAPRPELATVVCDLDRRRVIDVVPGCTRRVIESWLTALSPEVRLGSRSSRSTPLRPTGKRSGPRCLTPGSCATGSISSAARTPRSMPSAVSVSATHAPSDRRARDAAVSMFAWRPELYQARHGLLKASERLTERERRRLCDLFGRDPVLAEAWGLKERFRHDLPARPARRTPSSGSTRFSSRSSTPVCLPSTLSPKECAPGGKNYSAYFDEPTTNGYAEGVINKVKVIKRRAYGLPTFAGFRKRIVIACG